MVVEIGFAEGNPVSLNGRTMDPVALIRHANTLAGSHGYGRIDMIEDRVVGIKSREIYETPGMLLLIRAHQELESVCLAADGDGHQTPVGAALGGTCLSRALVWSPQTGSGWLPWTPPRRT